MSFSVKSSITKSIKDKFKKFVDEDSNQENSGREIDTSGLTEVGMFSSKENTQPSGWTDKSQIKPTSSQAQEVILQLKKFYYALQDGHDCYDAVVKNTSSYIAIIEFSEWWQQLPPTVQEGILKISPELSEQIIGIIDPDRYQQSRHSNRPVCEHFLIYFLRETLNKSDLNAQLENLFQAPRLPQYRP